MRVSDPECVWLGLCVTERLEVTLGEREPVGVTEGVWEPDGDCDVLGVSVAVALWV